MSGEMFSGCHGPTCKSLLRTLRSGWRPIVIERIPVIENEQSVRSTRYERSHQPIVSRKIVNTLLLLCRVPFEIHSHPANAGLSDHFDFTRLRIGKMNVHTDPSRDRLRPRPARPGCIAVFTATMTTGCKRNE